MDSYKKQMISAQIYKNEAKDKDGLMNPLSQTSLLLFKIIIFGPPAPVKRSFHDKDVSLSVLKINVVIL